MVTYELPFAESLCGYPVRFILNNCLCKFTDLRGKSHPLWIKLFLNFGLRIFGSWMRYCKTFSRERNDQIAKFCDSRLLMQHEQKTVMLVNAIVDAVCSWALAIVLCSMWTMQGLLLAYVLISYPELFGLFTGSFLEGSTKPKCPSNFTLIHSQ